MSSALPSRPRLRVSAYTNKLDFELDTALHFVQAPPPGGGSRVSSWKRRSTISRRACRKKGDLFANQDPATLDDASRWSFSLVVVIPIAPF